MAAGETFVIMGLSGSGKSTLIRHFNRLVEPTSGSITVDGEDIVAMGKARLREFRRRKVSMVFQNFGLLPHRTVLDNVAYGLLMQGRPKAEQRERAAYWISQVGLAGYEGHYPRQLSGGMKQRVGLARALAGEAEILLMDEAFSALDPLIRGEMQEQLASLQKELGKTVVFITHDPDEAMLLGDRIAILREGSIQQIGTPEQILLEPANDYIARFVKSVNRARFLTAGQVMISFPVLAEKGLTREAACAAMADSNVDHVFVTRDGALAGVLTKDALQESSKGTGGIHVTTSCKTSMPLEQVTPLIARSSLPVAVVDLEGRVVGGLTRAVTLRSIGELTARSSA
ncbi:betaine/proline/choline family ABC transporter ATP-binding protein [Mesorhizobium sp. IRAMC:0171]|uniref:Quaternary amine transport ATP-binding protein n=2 Tax=Mesorhizobium retamae TaxID=2912854 RepID=A0ABS9QDB2_9HYPH|nr:betaine/proline/choline family ABC transporter ATP-binding protein [Mesorhizobium sp. IRAMC:0171]